MKKFGLILIMTFVIISSGCIKEEPFTLIISTDEVVQVGSQMHLSANAEVEWSSSDSLIAVVDELGIVYGMSQGNVIITATLKSNSEITQNHQVTVIPSTTPPCEECLECEECEECPKGGVCPTFSFPEPISEDEVYVKLGIDRIDEYLDLFTGKRVGLITNQTGFNRDLVSTIDILHEKVNLVALFAPEHGIRGDQQAGAYIPSYVDEQTGVTVYSLYGSTVKPTVDMMNLVDILCIDIQDAGARFYTYVYTMAYAMEACQENGKTFIVFDRPNPAGGQKFEGNILDMEYSSFIGKYPIVQRHGMTIAELAYMFNEEFGINCDLKVVLMEGWGRYMYYDDTKLPWVVPSPNFPSVETAIVYPGTCIIEGTNMSEGRGTTTPFQVVGAPYINAWDYALALNALNLPGVIFRPASFTPTFSKHTNTLCHGVQVHVIDRDAFQAVKTGWALVDVVRDMYPNDFAILNASTNRNSMNLLTGGNFITKDLYTLEQQFALINADTQTFSTTRSKYLLYIEEPNV